MIWVAVHNYDGRAFLSAVRVCMSTLGGNAYELLCLLRERMYLNWMGVQDERYVNWWFWKHMNDSAINTRWLKPSYLYPFRETGSCNT